MKTNYLFPTVFGKIGRYLFVPAFILGICYLIGSGELIEIGGSRVFALFNGYSQIDMMTITENNNWSDEIIVIILTISMLFIGFSREKDEDECIATIRMNALVWAIMLNSALLIIGTLFIYGMPYLTFMTIYMFSLLLLFIIKYTYMLHKFRKNN